MRFLISALAMFAASYSYATPAQVKITNTFSYNQPPTEILNVMRAAPLPTPIANPTHDKVLLVSIEKYPSIARVATPFLRLAGVRIEPNNHSKRDTPGGYGIASCIQSLSLVDVATGEVKKISLSALTCADAPQWNANGKYFVLEDRTNTAVNVWIGDAQTAKLKPLRQVQLNPMFESELAWLPDQKSLLVKLVPKNLGPVPQKSNSEIAPSIQETNGEKGQSSTYEKRDTLNNKYDEALFDYYGTSQLARVDIVSGQITYLGKPALYKDISSSPSGGYLLVEKIVKPYSYLTTFERFPYEVEAWEIKSLSENSFSQGATEVRSGDVLNGRRAPRRLSNEGSTSSRVGSKSSGIVSITSIAKLPLADRVPIHGEPKGPRQFTWRATEPATLVWAEALDEGDWNVKVPHRDKIMMSRAPFHERKEILRTEQRLSGIDWFERKDLAFVNEYDENKHWVKTFAVNIDDPQQAAKLIWSLSWDDRYASPGQPVRKRLANGKSVIVEEQNHIYLAGVGASEIGDRPFLDRLNLQTLKNERLFRSEKTAFERFICLTDKNANTFLTWHQSPTDPPNIYIRNIDKSATKATEISDENTAAKTDKKNDKAELNQTGNKYEPGEAHYSSTAKQLTHIPDPTPQLRQIKKRLVKYKRADGVDLSFTLYTPPGYQEGTRVPTILYAYPLDYADASKAGQVSGSQMTFTQLFDYRLLLLAGYAIIDRAAFPIVGDPKKAYDTYMEQLIADAKAAVDEAVRLGVADPKRIGVTGHSHGALMTVNLLTHSDLFRAGVATSGSYNKTITPFGFQNERRTVWEAPDVYRQVSPFFFADKIKNPLLIIHGADDANPGTTPMQASFLYEAIRGNGGVARLVMLPYEPHWYTARESNEQEIYEMVQWFDRFVKN